MKATFMRKTGELILYFETSYNGIPQTRAFSCTSVVRNELNGRRKLNSKKEVVRTFPGNHPYMPRPFPLGEFTIKGVKYRNKEDPDYGYLGPAFIMTNAHHLVKVWELGASGGYLKETDRLVTDNGFGFHYARDSLTTHGCGRLSSEEDAADLATIVEHYPAGIPLSVVDE